MKESIKLFVLLPDGEEATLEMEVDQEGDTFFLYLDGAEACGGDWNDHLRPVLERALELWPARVEGSPEEET